MLQNNYFLFGALIPIGFIILMNIIIALRFRKSEIKMNKAMLWTQGLVIVLIIGGYMVSWYLQNR